MIVEPAYSPEDNVWFLEDGTTARSLSELQRKLPHAVIEGYYPKGYTAERPKEQATSREFRWSQMRSPQYTRKGPAPSAPKPEPQPVIEEPVVEEESEEVIEAIFEPPPQKAAIPEPEPVKEVVALAPPKKRKVYVRKAQGREGNRFATTIAHGAVPWDDEQDNTLRAHVEVGLTAKEIANLMPGRSRNAIIGRCHRKGFQLKHNNMFEIKNRKNHKTRI
jgi:hypothetical protein